MEFFIVQIAMISPGFNSCEHTLNTLRYADRYDSHCTFSFPPPLYLLFFVGV